VLPPPRYESVVTAKDLMTPRSKLLVAALNNPSRAARIAREHEFDAVPLARGGEIVAFWGEGTVKQLTPQHLVDHASPANELISKVAEDGVQFVTFRNEIVGLLDLSDYNKPLGRVAFLTPLMECEQRIIELARRWKISDQQTAAWLGERQRESAEKLRSEARAENLELPLLEFASFAGVLTVGRKSRMISHNRRDTRKLIKVRNRAAHRPCL